MKKHLLILASLVFGIGQLFAEEAIFNASDLRATLPSGSTKIDVPYTWKHSDGHVTIDIAKKDGTTGSPAVSNVIGLDATYQMTVSVAGAGTLNEITFTTNPTAQKANAETKTGTYSNGTWTPGDKTNSVTFTMTGAFRLASVVVDYTPDPNFTPAVAKPLVGPFEAKPIESIASYTGTEPYVFDMSSRKYYAYNNLNQYEEFGLYPEVNTLKVAGGGVTEIEYIATMESVGTHPFINTNYIPKANTKIKMDVDIENSTEKGWMAVFGARQGGWTNHAFVLFARAFDNQRGCYNRTGDEHQADSDIPRNQRMTIEALGKNCTFTLAGESSPAVTITTNDNSVIEDCTNNLFIFDTNTGGAGEDKRDNSYVYMKLYGCEIYEGETLVRQYVPIVDSEGNGGLKDKITGETIFSSTSENFILSPDGQSLASAAGISVYPGKLVINTTDNHQYNWNGTEWVDLGSVYKPITDTNYQNMNNWTCRFGYASTFDNIENSGNDNFFNPYTGDGDWEPYQCKVVGLTKGETYRVSFNFTSQGWNSWSSYTQLPVFVTNNWDFGRTMVPSSVGGEVLGYVGLPMAALTNQPYSFTFTADGTEAVLAIQFGVGDDFKDFFFRFDDLNVEFVDYPVKYAIDWVDPNKYTPLAYIEGTSQVRENPFTTPYIAMASTEVGIKFQSYGGGDWRAIFSGRDGGDAATGISLYQNGDQAHFGYFVGGYRNDNHANYPGHNQDITVTASLGNLNVNGTDYPTGQTTFNSSTRKISFFSNPEWDNAFRGRIYNFTIKEGGDTVYDFQPVMRHDGKFGYYDAATKTFIEPAQGNWNGYGYEKLADKAYVTYTKETRIVMVGSTAQFLPDVQNLDGATFTWSSANENIATVAADGTVTGVAAGKVTITVTTDADQGWTANYELTVSEPEYKRFDANNVGYAIVTGGNGWNDSPLSALLDNDATTKFGCSGSGDAWAIMIASEPVAVQQYSFVTGNDTYDNPGRTPRSWKLEGSNDNQTWTVIDEQVQNYKAKTSNKEETVFTVDGKETYKFFKFTAWDFDGGFQLGEFWINEQIHAWGEPTETASTCTVPGKKVWECTTSKVLKTETLPLAEHEYENGACACGAKVSAPVILANGATTPFTAKFRHAIGVSDNEYEDIEEGWANADFDDSAWDEMLMPLGAFGPYKTRWIAEYNTFWFRRPFTIENPAAITKLTLKVTHDDDCSVFLNGKKVWYEKDWTGGENDWRTIDVDPSLLVAGKNVLAVYIEQNFGGAYCDFSLEANVGATVEVSDAGYATFVAPVDVDFTGSEVTPKAATFDGTYVQLADVTTVPAGTAVVVKGAEGTYTVPATTDAVLGATNELIAATADVTADGTQYILAKQENVVGFAKATPGSTIAAGKGYLQFTTAVKAFYPFAGNDATGIEGIDANNGENAPIYNVAGQRLGKMQKGINIVGGKKVLK